MTLSDRIADVRRKARDALNMWDTALLALNVSAYSDLIIQMADRIEELEKALKPFADTWVEGIPEMGWPTADDFTAASLALKSKEPKS